MESAPQNRSTRRAFILLTFAAVFWGGTWVTGKLAVDAIPPLTLAAARFALASLLLWGWARTNGAAGHRLAAGAGPGGGSPRAAGAAAAGREDGPVGRRRPDHGTRRARPGHQSQRRAGPGSSPRRPALRRWRRLLGDLLADRQGGDDALHPTPRYALCHGQRDPVAAPVFRR